MFWGWSGWSSSSVVEYTWLYHSHYLHTCNNRYLDCGCFDGTINSLPFFLFWDLSDEVSIVPWWNVHMTYVHTCNNRYLDCGCFDGTIVWGLSAKVSIVPWWNVHMTLYHTTFTRAIIGISTVDALMVLKNLHFSSEVRVLEFVECTHDYTIATTGFTRNKNCLTEREPKLIIVDALMVFFNSCDACTLKLWIIVAHAVSYSPSWLDPHQRSHWVTIVALMNSHQRTYKHKTTTLNILQWAPCNPSYHL